MTDDSVFAALSDPTRRAVFERLADGPLAVGVIAQGLPVSRPAVSQHLKVLKAAGLVTDRPDGAHRVYQIDLRGLERARAWLDSLWNTARDAVKTEVGRTDVEERERP